MASTRKVTEFSILLMLIAGAHAQTMPTGCTYDSGLYECDYSTLSSSSLLPLQASGFSPIPQRLRLTGLPSSLTTAVFDSDFESFTASDYDTNYPASLELMCEDDGDLTVASGFLTYMGYIQEFKISNCDLGNIPTSAFSGLGDVDRFILENGTVGTVSGGMLDSVNIIRNTSVSPSFPKQHGAFIMKNTNVTGTFPSDILSGQTNLYELVLQNIGLSSLDKLLFQAKPPIRHLDLSHNSFSDVPANFFSDLTSLGVINMYGLDIECTCSKLWFLGYAKDNYLTLDGDIICSSTSSSSWVDKLAWQYYMDTCVEAPKECNGGIALAGACMSPIDLTGFSIGFIAFVLGWVVLGITIHTKRQMGPTGAKGKGPPRKPGAKRPPPKGGARGGKKGWA